MSALRDRRVTVVIASLAVVAVIVGIVWVMRDARDDAVMGAIRAYDEALVRTLGRLEPKELSAVTTDAQRAKVTTYVTYLWGNGAYMEASLLSIEPVSIRQDEQGYTVVVEEGWRFQKRDRRTRETMGGGERTEQTVRYRLVRKGGTLLVDDVEVLDE